MSLSKQDILAHVGVAPKRTVPVPAWGGDVIVRGMTVREFAEVIGSDMSTGLLLSRLILDDAGTRLFDDSDAAQLDELPQAEAKDLINAINDLSGLGSTPDEQAKVDAEIAGESAAQTDS